MFSKDKKPAVYKENYIFMGVQERQVIYLFMDVPVAPTNQDAYK
jgi:hypothetical protein